MSVHDLHALYLAGRWSHGNLNRYMYRHVTFIYYKGGGA